MKKVQLYVNSTKQEAIELANKVEQELLREKYKIVEDDADIVIGFGGDGTLLHFLKHNKYNVDASYIGVNCGTLGFLQDFNVQDVKEFVTKIPLYIPHTLNLIALEIEVEGNKKTFKALNEFIVQDACDKSFRTSIDIGGEFLEDFVGTGIIFSTPTGSTALNLSAGGAILHPYIKAIQITPREAISNSKMHCLSKSICIPNGIDIVLKPNNNSDIKIYSDGENVYSGPYDKIRITYSKRCVFKLKDKQDSFIKTIKEKLI